MNIRALRLFIEVMEHLTLSRASTLVHISQPAASRLIRLLEQETGETLFIRARKRLRPTPEAEALLPEAIRIVESIDNIPSLLSQSRSGTPAPLRILCLPRIADSLVLPALARLHATDPEQKCHIDVCPRRAFGRRLLHAGYDVGVSSLPIPAEGLKARILTRVSLHVMLHQDHELAGCARVTTAELHKARYIALNRHTTIRTVTDRALTREGEELAVFHEVATSNVAYWFVQNGIGFTFADPASVNTTVFNKIRLVPWATRAEFEIASFIPTSENPHVKRDRFVAHLSEVCKKYYPSAPLIW